MIATSDRRPPLAAVAAILAHFTGEIEQVPPAYSALKVDGQRAYDRARAGEEVELGAARVTIHSLELLHERARPPAGIGLRRSPPAVPTRSTPPRRSSLPTASPWSQTSSKGTYIRSLARDIAHALGTVGHVTYLRRTQAGPFTENQAISLDMLNEIGNGARLEDHLLPLEAGLDGIPALTLDPESAQAARQGRVLSGMLEPDGLYLATAGNVPVALMDLQGGTATVVRGLQSNRYRGVE